MYQKQNQDNKLAKIKNKNKKQALKTNGKKNHTHKMAKDRDKKVNTKNP